MGHCVGCGLQVNAGILEAHLKTNGGLICDPVTGELSVQFPTTTGTPIFPANPDPTNPVNKPAQLGCGITTDGSGKIIADTCTSGGLGCGAITGDSSCLYADVQNQGAGPVITLATATDVNNLKPNDCNGLVRTEQGLWAPPKVAHAAQITSFQDIAGSMDTLSFSKLAEDSDFPGSHSGANEWVVGQAGALILCFCFCNTSCEAAEGMTLSKAVTPLVALDQNQTMRFTLFERLAYRPNCDVNASSGGIGPGLKGLAWSPQSSVTFDELNLFGTGKHTSYQQTLVDHSWIVADPGTCLRGEMVLTYQRFGTGVNRGLPTDPPNFGPNGAPGNTISGFFASDREYIFWVTTAHGYLPGDNSPCHINVP